MLKPVTVARYSPSSSPSARGTGFAVLTVAVLIRCAPAQPPTQLTGPPQTNADDRAFARLAVMAWAALDELDPVARDEAGAEGTPRAWPPLSADDRAVSIERLRPVERRLAQIPPAALSPKWRAARTLLRRRLDQVDRRWDALSVQTVVGRGLWASLGPEAWPAARGIDRLQTLERFLALARSTTVAATRDRLEAASAQLQTQRAWVADLTAADPDSDFEGRRNVAEAALEVHAVHLQNDLLALTGTVAAPIARPWSGRWAAPPSPTQTASRAEARLAELQTRLLALAKRRADRPTALARAKALIKLGAPPAPRRDLNGFLSDLRGVLKTECPSPPAITATAAPEALRGLAAVRLDAVAARTSTAAYRLWLSVDDDARTAYPMAKTMALALYEGWPGRALADWAVRTRADRGLTERRWPDPVLAAGWPLFALDALVAHDRLVPAVHWHVLQVLLRAVVDAQVDLRVEAMTDDDDEPLITWLTVVGRQSRREAKKKLKIARAEPGRLSAPFIGWQRLAELAKTHLGDPAARTPEDWRRFAACTEWPPDLLPSCLQASGGRQSSPSNPDA